MLPEKRFPCALQDVESVYQNLRDPSIAYLLGFEVNRIIVTGESAGGNLAAALCIKLQMNICNVSTTSDDSEVLSDASAADDEEELDSFSEEGTLVQRLPDAMMLSCPVLDFTSGKHETNAQNNIDPVLSNTQVL